MSELPIPTPGDPAGASRSGRPEVRKFGDDPVSGAWREGTCPAVQATPGIRRTSGCGVDASLKQ